MPEYIPETNTSNKKEYDVLIVGGGVTGITTALLLQKTGLQCLVAEAHNLCFGTTGGTTAHLNTFLDTVMTRLKRNLGKMLHG